MLVKRLRKPRPTRVDSLIGRHSRVLGEFRFSEGLHIDGLIKGDVVSDVGASATLTLSESGTVEGHVRVPFVIISGVVKGDVYADDYVELGPTARIEGDVYYGLIEMAMCFRAEKKTLFFCLHPCKRESCVCVFRKRKRHAMLSTC